MASKRVKDLTKGDFVYTTWNPGVPEEIVEEPHDAFLNADIHLHLVHWMEGQAVHERLIALHGDHVVAVDPVAER